MEENIGITFNAIFAKATTLVDGGWRISLDLEYFEGPKVSELAKLSNQVLQVAIVPINDAE